MQMDVFYKKDSTIISKNLRVYKSETDSHKYRWTYNFQCMLRHKKILDIIKFPEKLSPISAEVSVCNQYNLLTNYGCDGKFKVLMYLEYSNGVHYPVFKHIGISTIGGKSPLLAQTEYKYLFE